MRRFSLILLVLMVSTVSMAQSIRIIRVTDFTPVKDVFVYNLSKTASSLSNDYGILNIEDFSTEDTLVFQHPSFEQRIIPLDDILEEGSVVYLTDRLIDLNPVTVSATRWEAPARAIPNRITEITRSTITYSNPQTAADMLRLSGQVFVQKSQLGGGSPMIRGFSANSLLLVVDGVRLNNAIYRSGNLHNVITLDALSTESAEVLYGPGTVIYGSDALGGVIHYSTLENSFTTSGLKISGAANMRYSSANKENTGHLHIRLSTPRFSSLTSVTLSSFDHLRAGKRPTPGFQDFGQDTTYVASAGGKDTVMHKSHPELQFQTGYEQNNFLQKFAFAITDHLRLDYNFHYSRSSDIPRYDRLEMYEDSLPVYAYWYYGPQVWSMHHLRLSHDKITPISSRSSISASYQNFEESRFDRKFDNYTRRERREYVKIVTVNLDVEKKVSKHIFDYGLEGLVNFVDSKASQHTDGKTESLSTRYPDGGSVYKSLAAYLSHSIELNKKLSLRSGIRYTYTGLNSELEDTSLFPFPYSSIGMRNGALNGSVGFVWEPSEELLVKMLAGSGFRAPNLDDAAKVFDSEPGNVLVPNPDLRPEYAYNLELNVSRDILSMAYIQADVYYTLLRDAMVRGDFLFDGKDSIYYDGSLSHVQAIVNSGSAYIYGFTLRGGLRIQRLFHLTGFITYTEGRDTYNDEPLRHAPPTFGRIDLHYRNKRFQGTASWSYNLAKPWDDLAPSEQGKPHLYTPEGSPAWSIFDLRFSYAFNENVLLTCALENVLDQHYRPYSSGISGPGRNLVLAIRVGF